MKWSRIEKLCAGINSTLVGCIFAGAFSLLLVGCSTTAGHQPEDVGRGQRGKGGSFFGPVDIEEMAKRISDRMVETPQLMNTKEAQNILVLPPANQTTFTELSNSDALNEELITELYKRKEISEKVHFINRGSASAVQDERRMIESGAVSGSSNDLDAGANFLLRGKFMSTSSASGSVTQTRISYVYVLIDRRTQREVFREAYTTRREGERSKAYQ